jgi:hypothetical protein
MNVATELFREAHAQLLERDQELLLTARHFMDLLSCSPVDESSAGASALRNIHHDRLLQSLRSDVAEQSAWARRSAEEVIKRDELIAQLQAAHAQQVAARDEIISQLQAAHAEQVTARDEIISQLQAAHAEQVAVRDEMITQLQAALAEKTTLAQQSAEQLARRDALIRQLEADLSMTGTARFRRWLRR